MSKKGNLVLIADDERDIREFMKTLVGFFGYDAITAEDGAQAIEAAIQHQPELILMDLSMPNLDGFKAISKLKQDPLTLKIPVIAFSGLYMDAPIRARLLDEGASDFLPKPVDTDALYESMTVALTGDKPTAAHPENTPLDVNYGEEERASVDKLISYFKDEDQ